MMAMMKTITGVRTIRVDVFWSPETSTQQTWLVREGKSCVRFHEH